MCVIGGGDSAMEEATFLTRFCTRVYLLHRRNSFRASKIMTERALANAKITPMYDVVVDEVLGDGAKVTGVRMRNLITKETLELPLSGLFLAIGHIPNSDVLKGLVDCNEEGYVRTKDKSTYTNVEGIFAWCALFHSTSALTDAAAATWQTTCTVRPSLPRELAAKPPLTPSAGSRRRVFECSCDSSPTEIQTHPLGGCVKTFTHPRADVCTNPG